MKINKLFVLSLIILPAFLFQSCLKDEKELFEESASARLETYLNKTQQTLISAENGWILEYYPDQEQSLGGFSYTVKFTAEEAEITFENQPGVTDKCLYSMVKDNGPGLSFDSYSKLVHFFATPNTQEIEGKNGDFEFVIDSVAEDLIKVHGKRYDNTMYFRRLNEKPLEYQKKVIAIGDNFKLLAAEANVNGQNAKFDFDTPFHQVTITTNDTTVHSSYSYTDKGIRLYQPVRIGNVELSEIAYNDDNLSLAADGVSFSKLWLNPKSVTKVIHNIGTDDEAFYRTYHNIKHLDQFTFTTSDDWITVTKEGDNLTIEAAENNTGDIRTGIIVVSNGSHKENIILTQCEKRDILGDYYFGYTNNDGQDKATMAKVLDGEDHLTLSIQDADEPSLVYDLKVDFDQSTASLQWFGGESGTLNFKGKDYYMITSFMFNQGQYVSFHPSLHYDATFQHNDKNGTFAIFSGEVPASSTESLPIEGAVIWLSDNAQAQNQDQTLGWIAWIEAPYMVKKANSGAKPLKLPFYIAKPKTSEASLKLRRLTK